MRTLREWRAERLMSIRALADAAGVAPTTVQFVETGRSTPTFRVVRVLSAALGIQPGEITEFATAIEAKSRCCGGTTPLPDQPGETGES